MAEEDLIFGKNRHLFGGIEPGSMVSFTVAPVGSSVMINAVLPSDTVINGQTVCTVAGAVIRRKSTTMPVNEFDGEFVADVKESGSYEDTGASYTGLYHYAAFPYTTQGVYCRPRYGLPDEANRYIFNGTKTAAPVLTTDGAKVIIDLTAIRALGYAKAVIRKSSAGCPLSETDGESVFDGALSDSTVKITDSNVKTGSTYYYTVFPILGSGFCMYSSDFRKSIVVNAGSYIYGFNLIESQSDPANRISYPSDVDNASYAAAKMNFTSGKFETGGWDLTPGTAFMPRPCMLKKDGTVDYYLDPDDYTKKADGTASDVANTDYEGNAMLEWPQIYTKRWHTDGIYYFRCSDVPQDSDWDCWCNYNKSGALTKHFYTPIYMGSLVNSTLRSISGKSPHGHGYETYDAGWAEANGEGWYIETLADQLLMQDLMIMISKTTDTQAAFGNGYVGATDSLVSGTMNDKGMFWGSNSSTSGVKVFGMEHPWGNAPRKIAGLIFGRTSSSTGSVPFTYKITRSTHDGTTIGDYSAGTDDTGYLTGSMQLANGSTNSGYISSMTVYSYGRLPYNLLGSSSTYEADSVTVPFYSAGADRYMAGIGGKSTVGAGMFCLEIVQNQLISSSVTYRV